MSIHLDDSIHERRSVPAFWFGVKQPNDDIRPAFVPCPGVAPAPDGLPSDLVSAKEKHPPGWLAAGKSRVAQPVWKAGSAVLAGQLPVIVGSMRSKDPGPNEHHQQDEPGRLDGVPVQAALVAEDPDRQQERANQDERRLIAGGNFVEEEEQEEGKERIEQHFERQPHFPQEKDAERQGQEQGRHRQPG